MSKLLYYLKRNKTSLGSEPVRKKEVNLEWWGKSQNIGDCLAPVIYRYMLQRRHLLENQKVQKTVHLMTIGSIIGMGWFDAVIWGSGLHTQRMISEVIKHRQYVNYDVRAVRGPITSSILQCAGYESPDIWGDPAVLMPLIWNPDHDDLKKKYPVSVIRHYRDIDPVPSKIHTITTQTSDYRMFIKEILSSELIISSSLHGLILAETYKVPAIFLNRNNNRDSELLKYLDWYYSTGRLDIRMAHSIEEAILMTPMDLPKLKRMQTALLNAFPYDLWQMT